MEARRALKEGLVNLLAVMLAVIVGASMALLLAGCAPAAALRRLEADNAALRARLDGENDVREALLAECNEARVALEVECVADRVSIGELEYCPAFEACMQDCITGGADLEGCDEDTIPAGD